MAAATSLSLPLAPPPWGCKATAYVLAFYNSPSSGLPRDIVYDPVEAEASSFSSPEHAGTYRGGLCMAQVLRYTDTPVGSYDELAILPGYFDGAGSEGGKRKDLRITGIWVSQEATLMNGRRNWNIPKHLARFTFAPTSPSSEAIQVQVFSSNASSTQPFFSARIKPIPYTPCFPFSSSWLGYLGMSTYILQPPLPEGKPPDVVPGTDKWLRSHPLLKCSKAKMVWFDMKQPEDAGRDTGIGETEGDTLLAQKRNENWWPRMRRWHLALYCPNASLELGEPEILDSKYGS